MTVPVSKESVDRLLNTLTDIIRPFSEARGLKADQIRLQREDVLIQIAQKALSRANIEGVDLKPIPNKALVPFLEKASLEDLDLDMQDRWANLLLSASKHYHAQQLTFIDILSRLSSEELMLLEDICLSFDGFPDLSYPGGHMETNRMILLRSSDQLKLDEIVTDSSRTAAIFKSFVDNVGSKMQYGRLLYATIKTLRGTYYHYTSYAQQRISLDILQREKLIDIEAINRDENDVLVGYFNITPLGVRFVDNCTTVKRLKT